MIKLRSREQQKLERLNLVPIMDAVFIFIFFLLFSAQFIELVLLEAEAPVVSNISKAKELDEEPLNLNVKIFEDKLEVYTGLVPTLQYKIFLNDKDSLTKFKNRLIEIRKNNPKDDELIISPLSTTNYDQVIKVIEASQVVPKGLKLETFIDGKRKNLRKIYSKIVLEPLEE